MAEYIDREALLSAAHKLDSNTGVAVLYTEDVLDFIRDFPAADVAPVRHGRWVEDGGGKWHCSVCGHKMEIGDDYFDPNYFPIRFCENCGARMDGGADNIR